MPRLFRSPKRQGEWAESRFLARALELGLTVSVPWGDSSPFDFIVGSSEPLYRVQVRSTAYFNGNGYRAPYTHARYRRPTPYTPRIIDMLALYVIPHDAWYIIPARALRHIRNIITVFPNFPKPRGLFEKFREAWHLLKDPKAEPRRS